MEDRVTPFLYLELTDRQPLQYADERAGAVLEYDGVERATVWQNCVPGRTDLPMRMADFATLGLYECGPAFETPMSVDGVTGLHFEHGLRPGQGTVAPGPTLGLELVLVSPREPRDAQALRDWGDFVHIHDIAAASPEHFTMITAYENVSRSDPRYLHLYELDTDDPEPWFQAMTPTTRERLGSWNAHPFDQWAWHPALTIDYVNTFSRVWSSH